MASILVAVVGVCTITMSVKGGGVVKPHLCSKIKVGARLSALYLLLSNITSEMCYRHRYCTIIIKTKIKIKNKILLLLLVAPDITPSPRSPDPAEAFRILSAQKF